MKEHTRYATFNPGPIPKPKGQLVCRSSPSMSITRGCKKVGMVQPCLSSVMATKSVPGLIGTAFDLLDIGLLTTTWSMLHLRYDLPCLSLEAVAI